jgi:hypothetical protein
MLRSTPAWAIDAPNFRRFLDQLGLALRRPPSAKLSSLALGGDARRVSESLRLIANAARDTQVDVDTALAARPGSFSDSTQAARLAELVTELSGLWRVRVAMAIRPRRVTLLRSLLREPAPDFLGIIRKEHDENAHSDVLRWLLDPNTAPTIAPVALHALVSRLPNKDEWRSALQAGLALRCIYVRREMVIGNDLKENENRDRIDLMIEGPGFVLGIENKVFADEHEGQTRSYTRWLRALGRTTFAGNPKLVAGLFLSPSGGLAGSSLFSSLSYLELCACLLDVPAADLLTSERQVLAGYMKTLQGRILRAEFQALLHMEGEYERLE